MLKRYSVQRYRSGVPGFMGPEAQTKKKSPLPIKGSYKPVLHNWVPVGLQAFILPKGPFK